MRCVALWQDHLHDQQAAVGGNCRTALAKNGNRLTVVPIMQDVGKDICIMIRWHRFEEVTSFKYGTRRDARRGKIISCICRGLRQIEEYAPKLWVCIQDSREKRSF